MACRCRHSSKRSLARAVKWAVRSAALSIVGARYVHAQTNLGNILPLGDSITVGDGSPATPGGYRDPLYSLLTDANYDFTYVGSQTTNPTAPLTAAAKQTMKVTPERPSPRSALPSVAAATICSPMLPTGFPPPIRITSC